MSARRPDPVAEAMKLQRAAARQGFDWRNLDELWHKLAEEVAELQQARSRAGRRDELGDLMFMLINISRHLGLNPEKVLAGANRKFKRRYGYIHKHRRSLPSLGDARRLDAMETLWQEAKRLERRRR